MSLISTGVWTRKWRLRFKLCPWPRGRGAEFLGSSVRNSLELRICLSGPGPEMLLEVLQSGSHSGGVPWWGAHL